MDRALDALAHRGPDGRGSWYDEGGGVALGHVRLALVGLDNGAQPIANEDGSLQAVVNGEFYDHRAIRQRLESEGHRFRTQSDSEILLHLWEDRGRSALDDLEGEFAFVLWDVRQRKLYAARDRFGVKPLYYARQDDALLLASEAKALFAAGVPARWDPDAFFQMCHLYYPQGSTLFHNVRQIAPGHILTVEGASVAERRYWDIFYPLVDAPLPERTPLEQVEQTRSALRSAVLRRLDADVPVGCYLSGGLDSSVLLGLAAQVSPGSIQAFTVAFDDDTFDESAVAVESARQAGVEHHVLRVTSEEVANHFEAAVGQSETINPNTNGVAKYLLSATVRAAGLKTVLTGEGADEAAAGYDFLVRDAAGQAGSRARSATRGFDRLRGPGVPSGEAGVATGTVRTVLGFVPAWVAWFAEAAAHSRALWHPNFTAAFASRDAYAEFLASIDIKGQLTGREPMLQSLYLWNKSLFPNLLLNQLADRMEMAHGIEGRVPFLDTRLFELLRDMPTSMKIRGVNGKHVLREAAKPWVTDQVFRRRKQAFLAPPPRKGGRRRLDTLLQDLIRSETMRAVPFFDHRKILRFLDGAPDRGSDGLDAGIGNQLVYLASACVLHKRYGLGS